MSEWGVDPVYIVNNWSEELLLLLMKCLVIRVETMAKETGSAPDGITRVSKEEFLSSFGG